MESASNADSGHVLTSTPPHDPSAPACLLPLPGGPGVSGVARFVVRLAGGLAERGLRVGIIQHAANPDVPPMPLPTDPRVSIIDCSDLPPVESAPPEVFFDRYSNVIAQLAPGGPVTLVLGQHAGPFAIVAQLAAHSASQLAGTSPNASPGRVRTIGVAHSDNTYDTRVLTHYEPMLHAMVGVSDELTDQLRTIMPSRHDAITTIPYGVEIPSSPSTRPPIGGRPLRLLYAGRIEHRQKRILALPLLAAELDRRGITHELTIVGDGPAREDLLAACQSAHSITLRPPASPDELTDLLNTHDAFVLPSRFEGLSIAMLEALAHGCVPVVAPSRSGTAQAVLPGVTGEVADVTPDDDEAAAGLALADAIDTLRRRDLTEMAQRCHAHAATHFALDRHIDHWTEVVARVTREPARPWPTDRSMSFDAAGGSVPADAAMRFQRVADALAGAPVAIHGAGAHTRALADVLASANVVCITDDDRQRHGDTLLGIPIVDPVNARDHGAAHVIISTHLHETDVWRRRAMYERQGLTVHRLYADAIC